MLVRQANICLHGCVSIFLEIKTLNIFKHLKHENVFDGFGNLEIWVENDLQKFGKYFHSSLYGLMYLYLYLCIYSTIYLFFHCYLLISFVLFCRLDPQVSIW